MKRLIDAEDLKKEIKSAFSGKIGLTVTSEIHEIIDRQPTIDPESLRPTAHWVKDGDAENPYRGSGTKYHCSACGRRAGYKQRWLYKFCPCCGAKMEDESDGDVRC